MVIILPKLWNAKESNCRNEKENWDHNFYNNYIIERLIESLIKILTLITCEKL
jgi:hypothetical protein